MDTHIYEKEKSMTKTNLKSEMYPRREIAVLETLHEVISIVQENRILQDIGTDPNKKMPKWYIDLIESLIKLYDSGHPNPVQDVEELR